MFLNNSNQESPEDLLHEIIAKLDMLLSRPDLAKAINDSVILIKKHCDELTKSPFLLSIGAIFLASSFMGLCSKFSKEWRGITSFADWNAELEKINKDFEAAEEKIGERLKEKLLQIPLAELKEFSSVCRFDLEEFLKDAKSEDDYAKAISKGAMVAFKNYFDLNDKCLSPEESFGHKIEAMDYPIFLAVQEYEEAITTKRERTKKRNYRFFTAGFCTNTRRRFTHGWKCFN
ncbi:hypothetical protein JCM33374_g50 [Metschnikowia sp. JCM 33374]|nr:hypothetical protein JCM33374_g50 [Metschnikowia sp. JCM 33374]